MTLYSYFKKKAGNETGNPLLLDKKGHLSKLISSYISEANKEAWRQTT